MTPSLRKSSIHVKQSDETDSRTNFLASGHPILTDVPENLVATAASPTGTTGCFVGFSAGEPRRRHVASIGKLSGIRFMSLFRFKLWWTTHWVGTTGNHVESETQFMMLDRDDAVSRPYLLLLPLIEGSFRASLQPGAVSDHVDVCVESGSTRVVSSGFRSVLYFHVGNDSPYGLVREAMCVVRKHLGSFRLLEEKTPPPIVDKFGWCTWDAFYKKVSPKGVREGIIDLAEGSCPPGMIIIDDGWQCMTRGKRPRILPRGGQEKESCGGVELLGKL
ncbi:hypothetical protein L484_014562 [Morus notabilis]|uniref:galactinol--sucrose galactosyltransferase n=1 Tax=Morus notabilis TaxID=981085 RepID=W9S7J2_9ROSA|nr:hypothetical protein L484_014562 [Morus notabilis]